MSSRDIFTDRLFQVLGEKVNIPDLYATMQEIISLRCTYTLLVDSIVSHRVFLKRIFFISTIRSSLFLFLHLEVVIQCAIVSGDTIALCTCVLLPEDTLRQVRAFVVHYMHSRRENTEYHIYK